MLPGKCFGIIEGRFDQFIRVFQEFADGIAFPQYGYIRCFLIISLIVCFRLYGSQHVEP